MVNSDSIENFNEESINNPTTNGDINNNDTVQSMADNPVTDTAGDGQIANAELNAESGNNSTQQLSLEVPQSEPAAESPKETENNENVSSEKLEQMIDEGINSDGNVSDLKEKSEENKVENQDEATAKNEAEDNTQFDEIFAELKEIQEARGTIEVLVHERIRGGLRVYFKEMPMFLPASHFSLKRNPSEESLVDSIGTKFKVNIHELQEDGNGRKTVIVTRKNILENDFWEVMKPGDIVEGVVSSIADFGIFLDIGGVEGLIHVSRLSQSHVENPRDFAKRGQYMQAVVVDINKDKKRIALSTKELEESPWKGAEEEFAAGSVVKGIVRRITDFGAYVELKPGIDGLLRTNELSWTRRVKHPEDVIKVGDEIEVAVLNVSEAKQTASLSLRNTLPNPWVELAEKYQVGSTWKGNVLQVMQQGAVITLNDEVDGFMPRSKMKVNLKGKKAPFNVGDEVEVIVADIVPGDESLILSLPESEDSELVETNQRPEKEFRGRDNNRRRDNRRDKEDNQFYQDSSAGEGSFTFQDLLSDKVKKSLLGKND